MSPVLFIILMVAITVVDLLVVGAVCLYVIDKTEEASERCMEENQRDREDMAKEYKAFSNRNLEVLKDVANALHGLSERLPTNTELFRAIERKVSQS